MLKTREGRLRALAYVGIAILALASVGMVAYLMGTPGWGSPLELPKVGK